MEEKIKVYDKYFKSFISEEEIQKSVTAVASKINQDFQGKKPLFLIVLNGAFMFASDLMKKINLDCELSFIKIASYHKDQQENLEELIGLNQDLTDREIIVVEDVVDSGNTIEYLIDLLKEKRAKEIKIATMFFKPNAYLKKFPIDYVGLNIGNEFIVGYGLDYDGAGRQFASVYQVCEA